LQWGSPSQLIQTNYFDRAVFLWTNGEAYQDSGATKPNGWVPVE